MMSPATRTPSSWIANTFANGLERAGSGSAPNRSSVLVTTQQRLLLRDRCRARAAAVWSLAPRYLYCRPRCSATSTRIDDRLKLCRVILVNEQCACVDVRRGHAILHL